MTTGIFLARFHVLIRLVVIIEVTFLKAKCLRTLFIIVCVNDNNHIYIYPLAFRVGDLENDTSYEWFLTKLNDAIRHIDKLFMISNHHDSIDKVIHKVFPHAMDDICTYHIGQNLKTKFKNPVIHN